MTDHPAYGTCPACTQGIGVKKNGRLKDHNRKVAAGNMVMTVTCGGSSMEYTEATFFYWDAPRYGGGFGDWKKFPVEVPITMHSLAGEIDDDVVIPLAYYADRHETVLQEWEHDAIRIHAVQLENDRVRLELLQDGTEVLKVETVDNDGAAPRGLALRWVEGAYEEMKAKEASA